jgi:hypothetical protein
MLLSLEWTMHKKHFLHADWNEECFKVSTVKSVWLL